MIMKFIIGAAVGAVLGLGHSRLAGCPTGACPLTRNPWITILYGALLGVLIAGGSR
jgi:hypothetical protein